MAPPVAAPLGSATGATPGMSLSDTVSDFPRPTVRPDADSEESVSVIVESPPMSFFRPLLVFIVAPLLLVAAMVAAAWLLRVIFS
jgi:hypothetical protein